MALSRVALLPVGPAAVAVGVGVFRVEPNGLGVVGDGLVVFALLAVGPAAIVIGVGVFWVEPNGLVVVGDGLVEVALFDELVGSINKFLGGRLTKLRNVLQTTSYQGVSPTANPWSRRMEMLWDVDSESGLICMFPISGYRPVAFWFARFDHQVAVPSGRTGLVHELQPLGPVSSDGKGQFVQAL